MRHGAGLLALLFVVSCRSGSPASAPAPETPPQCDARLRAFVDFVGSLPDRTVASAARGDLPVSTLGAVPGPGPVLDVSDAAASIDGTVLPGATAGARAAHLAEWAAAPLNTKPDVAAPAGHDRAGFYIATSEATDVQTLRAYVAVVPASYEVRLLVRTPKAANGKAVARGPAAPDDPATALLLEPNPDVRRQIAEKAYASLAQCPALDGAVSSVHALGSRERWPALKSALGQALPKCDCSRVDTARLQPVVTAEQQAGAAAVGFVPISFLRDEGCGASMPLRSMRKLIQQIERFDAEFAGAWQKDALEFGDVVTNDRLRVYFCSALPGETLAAKERARATLYLKVPGVAACEPWQFEPLAPGAPMGTWRRASGPSRPALAYHYWQAAEEIRVFGPVEASAPSKPTDSREWACEQTHRLTGMDDDSLELEGEHWFFDDAHCRKAPEASARPSPCTSAKPSAPADATPAPPAASAAPR